MSGFLGPRGQNETIGASVVKVPGARPVAGTNCSRSQALCARFCSETLALAGLPGLPRASFPVQGWCHLREWAGALRAEVRPSSTDAPKKISRRRLHAQADRSVGRIACCPQQTSVRTHPGVASRSSIIHSPPPHIQRGTQCSEAVSARNQVPFSKDKKKNEKKRKERKKKSRLTDQPSPTPAALARGAPRRRGGGGLHDPARHRDRRGAVSLYATPLPTRRVLNNVLTLGHNSPLRHRRSLEDVLDGQAKPPGCRLSRGLLLRRAPDRLAQS